MASRSPMAAMTRKALIWDMVDTKNRQIVGDNADRVLGHVILPYHSGSSREEIDRYERHAAERTMLTPIEQWCVARGFCENPFIKQVESRKPIVMIPVDFPDGRRTRVRSIDEAMSMLKNGAVRFWDVNKKQYVYA